MSRVFISYRHTPPDEDLAGRLEAFLIDEGLEVFVDKRMLVGTEWVTEIDRQLRAATDFVVLLSAGSILSDMVRQEVRLAHQLSQDGALKVLPIRVDLEAGFPYDLGAYLDRLQYASWKPGEAVEPLCEKILAAIRGAAALPHLVMRDTATAMDAPATSGELAAGAPLPAVNSAIEMETGTLAPDSPFYIERREDRRLAEGILRHGVTFFVMGERQCGKSSLVARAYAHARGQGCRAVYVDFQTFDEAHLANLQALLAALARSLLRELGIRESPERFWDGRGVKESFAAFMEEMVLPGADAQLVLCLDEVDRLFSRPYRDDFFAGMRNWHNRRATHAAWKRLNLVVAHVTDPGLWIQDLYQSPFNVGERLALVDFSTAEVAELDRRYHGPLGATGDLQRLMELVGGHPYLVRQALYALTSNAWSFGELERVALDDDGPFGDHLRRQLWALQQEPGLLAAVREVLRLGACEDAMAYRHLRLTGLVRGEARSAVQMRCKLYQEYLRRQLL